MEGVLVNVMAEAKTTRAISDLRAHNAQLGKATGNRDDSLGKYNFDVLAMQGEATVDNYNKYIKEHAHIGYKAHKEELLEEDFVLPRKSDDVAKVESIIVCPPEKVLLSEIDKYDFTQIQCFFDDYIHNFMKKDKKFKDAKILSAKVHCNEVYYPRFEETGEINPNGKPRLRRLSREESLKKAYIKIHMHVDYLPLVEAEKDGITYLKLCSDEIWKAQKGKYYNSYSEYNDRCYEAVGHAYGLERGQKWEDWGTRVKKKNNGEVVKEYRKLADWQLNKDEEETQRYIDQLKAEAKVAGDEARKQIEAEIAELENETLKQFELRQHEYAMQMKQMEDEKKKSEAEIKLIQKKKQQMIDDYDKAVAEYDALGTEVNAGLEQLKNKKEWIEKMFDALDDEAKVLVNIELQLKEKSLSPKQAMQDIQDLGLDEKLKRFKAESARENYPNLHRLANRGDDAR